MPGTGTHFTCFASTKVQILTPDALRAQRVLNACAGGWILMCRSQAALTQNMCSMRPSTASDLSRTSATREAGTQFTSFTGTKVPKPSTASDLSRTSATREAGTHFTSFTGTNVPKPSTASDLSRTSATREAGTQVTSFTGTKVQILTQLEEVAVRNGKRRRRN